MIPFLEFLSVINPFHSDGNLIKQAEQACDRLLTSVRNVQIEHYELKRSVECMSDTLHLVGGFIWRKDAEGRYLFANRYMCLSLFALVLNEPIDWVQEILGKTDADILDACGCNINPTFAHTSLIADAHTIECREQSKFLELCLFEGRQTWINTVRIPLLNEESQLVGTAGFGMESFGSDELFRDWIRMGNAAELHPTVYLFASGKGLPTPFELTGDPQWRPGGGLYEMYDLHLAKRWAPDCAGAE